MENPETTSKAKQELKTKEKAKRKANKGRNKARVFGFLTLVIGILVLIAGVIVLAANLAAEPAKRDAEYLVEEGTFALEGEEGVFWTFTEIGKGELTTDNYANTYNFAWAIEDGKLLMETEWLYKLNDEFSYEIDQAAGTMTLVRKDSNVEIVYRAVDEEAVTEGETGTECENSGEGGCNCEQTE